MGGLVHVEPLGVAGSPGDLLLALPPLPRLVALVGDWRCGQALVGWDPLHLADDPFDLDGTAPVDDPAAFGGGWIGVWGYQLGSYLERLPPPPTRPVPQPLHRVGYYDRVLRLVDGRWWLEQRVGLLDDDLTRSRREEMLGTVREAVRSPRRPVGACVGTFTMTPTPAAHRAAVAACQAHIATGDVYQANVTARLEASFSGDPLAAFCRGLRALAPAYAAFVDGPEGAVVSLSPELFLRREGRRVLSSPIKGTAPLTTDPEELARSAKDRAENVMIVDVVRNDLGRVAVPGSVAVPALNRLERHTVWHLVSDVTATLPDQVTDGDLLRATFPPASVTGAPKIRAMQLLSGLEATARETYTGAVGHAGSGFGLELNVAIRTFEVAEGRIWLGVGGGVVADSDPDDEYAECLAKAAPLVEALGGALSADLAVTPRAPRPVLDGELAGWVPRHPGVFDTLLVEDGSTVDPRPHLDRLGASARQLFAHALDVASLGAELDRHAASLTPGRHRLRVDLATDPATGAVDLRCAARPLDHGPDSVDLVPLVVPGGLGPHKWSDRSVLEPPLPAGRDRLVLDTDQTVLETGRACLMAVVDDQVIAPPLDGRQLPSTGRARVAALLAEVGAPLVERPLTPTDLARASEVLTVNALRGVLPVSSVEGVGRWPPGPVTRWLRGSTHWAVAGRPTDHERPLGEPARILLVDNYDSFTYNLAQCFRARDHDVTVLRNDAVTAAEVEAMVRAGAVTHVVVSPGPGRPDQAGISADVVRRVGPLVPTLGICLGHQVIAEVYGGRVGPASTLTHGKTTFVEHDGAGIYAGRASPMVVGRYHSLAVVERDLPDVLQVTSRSPDGTVMGIRHRQHPVEGIQWHPESILTRDGDELLDRFLRRRGRATAAPPTGFEPVLPP